MVMENRQMRRLSALIVLGFLLVMPAAAEQAKVAGGSEQAPPLTHPQSGEGNSKSVPAKNEALRKELRAMVHEDQRVRTEGIRAMGEKGIDPANPPSPFSDPKLFLSLMGGALQGMDVDRRNGQRMEQIVEEHGWPGKTLVGQDGAKAAWLLVQHQDSNPEFQAKCLALMEVAPEGDVEVQDVAYLTDRVLANQGKKQRYGTQMGANFEPRDLEDPENVDKRRAEVGLMPLDEYLKMAREVYEQMAAGQTINVPAPKEIAPGESPGAE
jgi:hypothetical protein